MIGNNNVSFWWCRGHFYNRTFYYCCPCFLTCIFLAVASLLQIPSPCSSPPSNLLSAPRRVRFHGLPRPASDGRNAPSHLPRDRSQGHPERSQGLPHRRLSHGLPRDREPEGTEGLVVPVIGARGLQQGTDITRGEKGDLLRTILISRNMTGPHTTC